MDGHRGPRSEQNPAYRLTRCLQVPDLRKCSHVGDLAHTWPTRVPVNTRRVLNANVVSTVPHGGCEGPQRVARKSPQTLLLSPSSPVSRAAACDQDGIR